MDTTTVSTCPQCTSPTMVRRVSALVWEGHSHISMHGTHVGVVGWSLWPAAGVSSYQGSEVTSLARVLAPPPPPPRRTAWWVWLTLLTLYCAAWIAIGVAMRHPSRYAPAVTLPTAILNVAICTAPALAAIALLIVFLVRRIRRDRQWRQAMPAMIAVWQTAWYCSRCGGAFLDHPLVPAHMRAQLLAPPAFRGAVYLAGIALHQGANTQAPT